MSLKSLRFGDPERAMVKAKRALFKSYIRDLQKGDYNHAEAIKRDNEYKESLKHIEKIYGSNIWFKKSVFTLFLFFISWKIFFMTIIRKLLFEK